MKQGSKRKFRRVLAMALVFTMLLGMPGLAALAAGTDTEGQEGSSSELRLWYNKPASQSSLRGATGSGVPTTDDDIWQKNTLPIGSGDLGANVYGEIGTERVTLNEKTLWTQGPTEQDPDYNGGNIIENGRNGEAMKEVEAYFKANPDATTVPSDMLNSFLGALHGYGYFAPWGELDIAYNSLAQVTEVMAVTEGCAVNTSDWTHLNTTNFTFSGSNAWYAWCDGANVHHGPGKAETSTENAYFTYSFTVPEGKTGTLDLFSHTGGGVFTFEFTQKPSGFTQAAVDATVSGGLLKSFSNLVPGNYTLKGTRKSGKVNLDYVKLTCTPDTTNYTRWLSLDDAVAGVQFTAEGVNYTREFFASNPDNVIAGKLTATGGTMDLTISLPKGGDMRNGTVAISDDTLKLAGTLQDNDMKYASYLKVVPTGGTVAKNSANNALVVTGATEVALFFTAATDYKMVYPVYRTGETDAQLDARVKAMLDNAVAKGYDTVRTDHLTDYHSLYGRVSVDVGQTSTTKPTDELIVAYQNGTASTGEQRLLEIMIFQFGRYLTVASSRENSQLPSNLQGVWNNRRNPPWNSDYHTNVNLQMNYWPTYVTNLAECSEPLVKFVEGLRIPGRFTAEVYAGVKSTPEDPEAGFMAHTQTTPFGWTCPGTAFHWGWSPAATPWLLQNVWDRYEFTGDLDYMRNYIYPMLKEEARLYDKMLLNIGTEDDPVLISAPAYSPEHGPQGTAGNTYEHSIIWQLYEDACTAADILGVDDNYIQTWRFNQAHLRGPIEIGASGEVKEWYAQYGLDSSGYAIYEDGTRLGGGDEGNGHRHLSHMLGIYPGDLIQTNEEWIEAARVAMNNRGDENTGWSMTHRANVWARLRDGNHALKVLGLMIKNNKFYNNLWDTHAPFQIDGNFGYTAGVAEMLLQSNMGYIDILPALPDAWSNGRYRGLLARGNFEVGAVWADKTLTTATITSKNGGECVVAYPNIAQAKLTDAAGNLIEFTFEDNDKISFNTAKGQTYTITDIPNKAATMVEGAAYRTGDDTVEVRWTAEAGTTYQVYRQIADGDILPIGEPNSNGRFEDETAYEDLGAIKYFIQAEGCELSEAISVQDLRGMGMIDDRDSHIEYSDGWSNWSETGPYSGTVKYIENVVSTEADVGQTIQFTFAGTGIEVIGGKRNFHGMMSVEIDGVLQDTKADFYVASGHPLQETIWSVTDLAPGIHTIKLTRLLEANPSMTGNSSNQIVNKIEFDAFKVLGNTPPEEENPEELEISTVGGVEKLWNAGDTVKFTANLDGVTWSASSSVTHATTCNYPNHKFSWNADTQTLTAGLTDEIITVTATKGTQTASKQITITPATTVTIVEDKADTGNTKNSFFTWSNDWGNPYTSEPQKHHGGSKTENGTSYSYSFTGTGTAIFVQKNGHSSWSNNSYTVVLDSGKASEQTKTPSGYDSTLSTSGVNQQKLVEFLNLENTTHTVNVTASGTGRNLDFVEIYAPNPNAPQADLEDLKAAVAEAAAYNEASYTPGSWATLANALNTASGYLNNTVVANQSQANAAAAAIRSAITGLVAKPLAAPENVKAILVEGTAVTLKWDSVIGATGYKIIVGSDTYETTATTYRVTGLESGEEYSFTVKAVNAASGEESPASSAVSKTTLDTIAPSQPTGLTWSGGTLSWTDSSDNVGVTGYKVLVNGVQEEETQTATSTTLTLSGGQNTVTVIAVDAAGNESLPAKLVIAPTFNVTANNATIEGGKTAFKAGEAVTVTATVPSGHILTGWTSADVDLAGETAETIHFSMPAKDVTLTANTEAKNWQVSSNLTNLTIDLPSNKTVAHGSGLTAHLAAPSPYKLPSTIEVTMGGVLQQAPWVVYSSVTGEITIEKVTGDVVITAENAIQTPAEGDTFSNDDLFGLPTALGETTKLQAEYMERTGDGLTAPNGPGFNNKHITGFVSGTTLKLYYDAPVAGTYTMTLNYRSSRSATNMHTLGWSGDKVTDSAVASIPNTLEGGTGVYKTATFDFTVETAGPGVVTFTTSSTGDGPELDWATFTLKSANIQNITELTLTPASKTLYTNETDDDHSITLAVTTTPAGANESISWVSSQPSVAYVEQDGTVVARAPGETTVTATSRGGVTSNAVTITVKTKLSGTVSVSGTPRYNAANPLTAAVNQLLPAAARATLTYQWKLDGTAITDATSHTYTIKPGDIGHQLTVEVTGVDPYAGTVSSNAVTIDKEAGHETIEALLSHVDCSADDTEDGKITGLRRDHVYQYQKRGSSGWPTDEASWIDVDENSTEITGLAPGSYRVRHAGDNTRDPGEPSQTITIYSASDSPNAKAISIPVEIEGGDVSASTGRALPGTEVTLTVDPDDGYHFTSLVVTGATGAVALTDNHDGTYTFQMPSEDVSVTATFTIRTYTIDHNLTNVTCNMEGEHIHTVNHGAMPTITLKPKEGYNLPETVKVYTKTSYAAGTPVEFDGYSIEDGVITFEQPITEDLVVTGDGKLKTYQINYQIPGLSDAGQPHKVQHGADLTVTLAPIAGYELPETVSIAMGGAVFENYTYQNGVIEIAVDIINGDIIIDAVGVSTLPNLESVTILGTPSMGQRLTAEVSPANASVTYQWRRIVDGVAISIEGAITSQYTLTADDVGYPITVRVTGTGEYGGILESEETEIIDQADVIDVTGVRLDRTAANVTIRGNTLLLTETVLPENATNKMVRWSSSDGTVATVSERGVVRGVGLGEAIITVTTVDGSKTATCTVTVVAVSLPATASVTVGGTTTIKVTVPDDLADKTLTWKSSDEEIATVDEDGVVTGVKAGTATITVTTGDGYKASCAVTVKVPSTSTTRPSTPPTTEVKEDGTKVTTETKPDGTKVETVETPDGTTAVTETKKDGTVKETVEEPDGTKAVTETKPDGSKTATVEQPDGTKSETVVTAEGDATITVTDPEGEELAKVELPAAIPEPEDKFVDIDQTPWAEEAINKVAGLELVKGIGGNKYDPVTPMTRGALATVLHRLSNGKTDYAVAFKDVQSNKYYTEGVAWAAKVNVVKGISEDIFAPDQIITREQLAVMLARYAKLIGMSTKADAKSLEQFTDGDTTGSWAVDGMAWCVEKGILKGKGANNLDPTADVSRAEVAVMLDRFIALIQK